MSNKHKEQLPCFLPHKTSFGKNCKGELNICEIKELFFVDKVWEVEFVNISSSAMCSAIYLQVLLKLK
jgi:hypothetical protein